MTVWTFKSNFQSLETNNVRSSWAFSAIFYCEFNLLTFV